MLKFDANKHTNEATNQQTGQKQYVPHYSDGGHKKAFAASITHRLFKVNAICCSSKCVLGLEMKHLKLGSSKEGLVFNLIF